MATEYAAPFAGSVIATSQQFRDRNKMLGPDGIYADVTSNAGLVSDGGSGASVNIQNMTAIVQGSMYQLTAGPLNLPVAANGGGSNRFDIVALTYDASHSPGIYARIIQGTPGAGLPAMTFNASGVWDFPLAHYEKTPAGAIVNMVDRRRFLDPGMNGQVLSNRSFAAIADAATDYVFPPSAARRGDRLRYWQNKTEWEYDGTAWKWTGAGTLCPIVAIADSTTRTTTSTTYTNITNFSTTFIAPPSGNINVHLMTAPELDDGNAYMSFEIRNNTGAGAVVLAASDSRGVSKQGPDNAQFGYQYPVSGVLTPGNTYWIQTLERSSSGGTATFFRRYLAVEPRPLYLG